MPDRARGRLAVRLTVLKLRRSPATLVSALSLPALVAFVWARESRGTALKIFLYLLPHVFLVMTQNMFKGEAAGGALENVLFVRGGFRRHILWKNAALVLAGVAYALVVFAAIQAGSLGAQRAGPADVRGFAASLCVGVYYIGLGGLLGHFLEGGSNVLVLIVAQAAAFVGLIVDASGGHRFVEALATGTFSGTGEQLRFVALAGILPNILVAVPLRRHVPWIVLAAGALFLYSGPDRQEVGAERTMSRTVLAVLRLSRRFGSVRAVRDISFSLDGGRVAALLGENGAGKSTAIRLALGFLCKDGGKIHINAGTIGYVPEQPSFFPWVRGDELLDCAALLNGIPRDRARRSVLEWCERLPFPPELLRRRVSTYSHGNRKKFAYLQSLILSPALFVADEPFSALDPVSIRNARGIFRELASGGCAVLLSSHIIAEVGKVYDDIIVVHRGEVVLRERREDLGPGADLEALFLKAIGQDGPALPQPLISNR